jgi:N-acetylglucosaminyldiphosphoundecaprenol N-acetyl-beta-D-mannosaminyltransferase
MCSQDAKQNKELRPGPQSIEILGVKVHKVTLMEALALLKSMALDGGPHLVITLNSEMIMRAQRDHHFRDIINNASLSLPDAMGIVWASRILGTALPERLAGVDTVERLAEMASMSGIRLFLLGAAPGIAERVAAKLQSRHPSLIIAGTFAGSPHLDEEAEICRRVGAAKPHVLLVAYEVPQQEYWIARNLQRLHVPVVINVGGSFDFIAGVTRRAPLWMREHGLEWLYRLICQPRRLWRMLALPCFAAAVLHHRASALLGK